MTMPAAPPPEWIDKATTAIAHEAHARLGESIGFGVSSYCAERALEAIWPHVLAAVAAHEQQLRQTIADEIERECQRPALMTVRREALDDAYASAYRILRTFDATFGSPDRTGAP